MKHRITVLAILCMSLSALSAGGKKETPQQPDAQTHASPKAETRTVKVVFPAGAPLVCAAKVVQDNPSFTDDTETMYEVMQTPDVLQARLVSGEADIAIVPSNLAAILYAKGIDIQCTGSVIWGLLYGVSTQEIGSISELKGKTILTFGRGLTPDITVRELLKMYGLIPDVDVQFTYVQSGQEAASLFISGKETIAILPEPMLSVVLSKNRDASVFLDIQQVWKETFGNASYPQACLVMKRTFINEYPDYAAHFMQSLSDSIEWAKNNPEQAGAAAAALHSGLPAPMIAKGIARMNMQFVSAADSRAAMETYFSVLLKAEPKFIGGSLPQDAFYYTPAK